MTTWRPAAMIVAMGLGLAACSGTTTADNTFTAPDAAATAEVQGPATASDGDLAADAFVPDVDVVDVTTGATVSLARSVASDKPVLLWAWAPHCPSCRAEAGDLESFAAQNVDRLSVVGIGTQDDLDYAKGFLADTGVATPQMLWDASFESWRRMGITVQPTWVLVNGDGTLIDGWIGALPEQEILDLV